MMMLANVTRRMYSTTKPLSGAVTKVVVIGSGLMGSGISQVSLIMQDVNIVSIICILLI